MLQMEKSSSVIIAFMLSVLMVVSILSKFSFISSIQIALFLLVLLLFIYLLNTNKIKLNSYVVTMSLFFVAACLSYINADFKVNVRDYLIILSAALMAGFSFSFLSIEWKKKVFIVPIFISLWLSMILFIRFVMHSGAFFQGGNFYENMPLNINVIAGFLALVYPLFFIYIKGQKNTKAFMLMTIFVLFAIFLTRCRIVILLSFISSFIFLLEYRKSKLGKVLIFLSIVLLVCSMIYVSMLKSLSNNVNYMIAWWKTALLIFKENIFFGCGLGNYENLFKAFSSEQAVNTLFVYNIFIQLLAEIGIVGLLSFVALLFSFYKKFIDRVIEGKDLSFYVYITLAVTSFIIINLVDYSFFVPTNMVMFFVLFSSMFNVETSRRKKSKIGFYVCLVIYAFMIFSFAKPVIANNYCKKGIDSYVKGYYKLAIEDFEKSIKLDKQNPEYYAQASRAYFGLYDKNRGEKGQSYADNAVKYLQKAIELNKYSAQLRASLASVYWNNDKKEEALKAIQEAIKYDKYNSDYEEYYYQIKNS